MSFSEKVDTISVGANGDQSSNQYKFVKMGASGFELQDTNGGYCLGILLDKPAATGRPGKIAKSGVVKVKASAAIAKGADVQSTSAGLAVTAAFSGYIMGEAMEAATAANDVIAVRLHDAPVKVRQGTESLFLGAPVLADVDRIVTSADWADGALTIAAQPDVPRNITVTLTDANASITAGTCTVVGTDMAGRAVTEIMDLTEGLTFTGTKIFASVTSATIADTEGTPASGTDLVTVGVGKVIGIPYDLSAAGEVLHTYLGGTRLTPTVTTGVSLSGVDASAGTYDGSKMLHVYVKPADNV
jgi:hypothetical protein